MDSCSALSCLPDIGKLLSLTYLSLGRCNNISKLPTSVTKLTALNTLNLDGCKTLLALPAGMSALTKLTRVSLCYCKSLKALPDLSTIPGLHTVESGLSCNKEGVVYVRGVSAKIVHSWKA